MAVKKITHTSTLPLDIIDEGRGGAVEYGKHGGDSYSISKSEYRQLGKPDKIRVTYIVEAVK